MAGWLGTVPLTVVEKGLDASSLRQKVLANNIANLDTPGFKRSDVDFQSVLDSVISGNSNTLPLETTSPQHLQGETNTQQPKIVTDNSSIQANGNNVDIDREMTNVAENDIYYQSLSQTISSQLAIIGTAIDKQG